jgi:hypothetical protein
MMTILDVLSIHHKELAVMAQIKSRIGATCPFGVVLLLAAANLSNAFEGNALYAKPGRFFTADDGAKLNFYCKGKGSPTVVFDSGEECHVRPNQLIWAVSFALQGSRADNASSHP